MKPSVQGEKTSSLPSGCAELVDIAKAVEVGDRFHDLLDRSRLENIDESRKQKHIFWFKTRSESRVLLILMKLTMFRILSFDF